MNEPVIEGAAAPPRRALSRRARFLGALIALLALAGLGWLAWDLTHQPPASANAGAAGGQGARPGGGGGGGGRGGAGGGAPPTTVGVPKAEVSSIPVTIEALG